MKKQRELSGVAGLAIAGGTPRFEKPLYVGTPNLPGDTMTMSGQITEKDDADGVVAIEIAGKNAWGNHVTGTVRIALPRGA